MKMRIERGLESDHWKRVVEVYGPFQSEIFRNLLEKASIDVVHV